MTHVPDKIVNKFAKFVQSLLLWITAIFGTVGVISRLEGNFGYGWFFIAFIILFIALSIKTTYVRTNTISRYK